MIYKSNQNISRVSLVGLWKGCNNFCGEGPIDPGPLECAWLLSLPQSFTKLQHFCFWMAFYYGQGKVSFKVISNGI